MAVGEENVRQGCVILFQLSQIVFGLGSGVHHNGMPGGGDQQKVLVYSGQTPWIWINFMVVLLYFHSSVSMMMVTRTIVDKADLHIGPKLAMLNVFQSLGVHQLLQKAS